MRNHVSYHDAADGESFYHGMMLGFCVLLKDTHIVESNRESGYGRFDLALFPKDNQQYGVILEFKKAGAESQMEEKAPEALEQLEIFVEGTISFIKNGIRIYGDSYFSKMDQYVQKYDMLRTPPRGKKVIWDSVLEAMNNPAFAPISESREMKRWKQKLKEGRETI